MTAPRRRLAVPWHRQRNAVCVPRSSLVLLLQIGSVSFLFTGDIEEAVELRLIEPDSRHDTLVLKVAHHGSITSTSRGFLEWADPELAIVSGEASDLHADVVQNLTIAGVPFFVTDWSRTVVVKTDGESVWVSSCTLLGSAPICGPGQGN